MARTMLITGAAKRIGRALALFFARDGWDIALHYRRSEKEAAEVATRITALGRKAHLVKADLRDAKAALSLIAALKGKGVTLECLINSASVYQKDSLATLAPDRWADHMDTNLLAPLLLMRDFAAAYKGKDGNIINITDGFYGGSMSPKFLSYTLSKQGLAFATRLLARELAPRIRINAIAPGATLFSKQEEKNTFTGSELEKAIPLKRASSPEEICEAARYILATPTLTGQTLSLSGGADAL
jgi:NAD(P)-dependent dehydrogenase (short-subunit alcohol dehydrogenase family)